MLNVKWGSTQKNLSQDFSRGSRQALASSRIRTTITTIEPITVQSCLSTFYSDVRSSKLGNNLKKRAASPQAPTGHSTPIIRLSAPFHQTHFRTNSSNWFTAPLSHYLSAMRPSVKVRLIVAPIQNRLSYRLMAGDANYASVPITPGRRQGLILPFCVVRTLSSHLFFGPINSALSWLLSRWGPVSLPRPLDGTSCLKRAMSPIVVSGVDQVVR